MASENKASATTIRSPVQSSHHGTGAMAHDPVASTSPPSKKDLQSWWKRFRKNNEKQEDNKGERMPSQHLYP